MKHFTGRIFLMANVAIYTLLLAVILDLEPESQKKVKTHCSLSQRHVSGKVIDAKWVGELYAVEVESRFDVGVYQCGSPNDVLFRACQEIKRGDRVEMCIRKKVHPVRGDVAALTLRRRR